jgi:hypothetical protein
VRPNDINAAQHAVQAGQQAADKAGYKGEKDLDGSNRS